MAVCFAFLYAPSGFLVLFSFNDAPGDAVGGISTRWYGVLWRDTPMIDAALLSLRVAVVSACLTCAVGATGGVVLARFGAFRLRGLFAVAVAAPLVIPEVITGLSLLLLFVALEQALTGWPAGRGAGTVTLAHASVSVAYVAVVVRARLADTGDVLEQAAMDLYAPPWRAFVLITLPLMAPALVSGWLHGVHPVHGRRGGGQFHLRAGASTLPMVVFSMTRLGTTPEESTPWRP